MKKVKITHRAVYHKIVEVEVFVPNTVEIDEYLINNEHLYVDQIDQQLSEAEYEFGFGMDDGCWTDQDQPSEWRYDCETDKIGGHL